MISARARTSVSIGSLRLKRSASRSLAWRSASRNGPTAVISARSARSSAARSISGAGAALGCGLVATSAAVGRAERQDLVPALGHEDRVLPLRRKRVVLRDDGPAVGQELHLALARVDHRLDGDRHSGHELEARSGPAVVQHLRILVEHAADAVPAVFAHDREALLLDEALHRVADVTEPRSGPDRADAAPHALEADSRQTLADDRRCADEEHPARVAVELVFDHGDVDVHNVAVLQHALARDAVADDVVHGRADRLREAAVVERRRDRAEVVHDVVVADLVEVIRRHSGFDVRADHIEHVGREAAGDAHLLLFVRRLDRDRHASGCRIPGMTGPRRRALAGWKRLRLRGSALLLQGLLWYKARASEATKPRGFYYTHAPLNRRPGALETGSSAGLRGGPTLRRVPWPTCRCAGCWKRACISGTKPVSGTRRCRSSSSESATRSTSSISSRRCRCTSARRSSCAEWSRTAARCCSWAASARHGRRSRPRRSAAACRT